MLKSGAPWRLWDDCLELEVENVYHLDGKVPEIYMSGETADISQLCELAWHNLIMYCPGIKSFPDEPL